MNVVLAMKTSYHRLAAGSEDKGILRERRRSIIVLLEANIKMLSRIEDKISTMAHNQ